MWKSEDSQWRGGSQLYWMKQIIQSSFSYEDSLADTPWRDSTQMYSVRKIIQWSYKSEKTSAGTLWREGSQMCKMREIIQSDWKSEDSSAHSQWREKANVCTTQQDIQLLLKGLTCGLTLATQMLSVRKIIHWSYRSEKTSQKFKISDSGFLKRSLRKWQRLKWTQPMWGGGVVRGAGKGLRAK